MRDAWAGRGLRCRMSEKPVYEPAVIESHAAMLYLQAAKIVVRLAIMGAIVGIAAGGSAGAVFGGATISGQLLVGAILGGLIGFTIGTSIGTARGFVLRLQAQVALCQVAIERNTRPAT